jgi:ribosomal protein L37E
MENEKNNKAKNITVRITTETYDEYKDLCYKAGYDISKRVRSFVKYDIECIKTGKNLLMDINFKIEKSGK